MLSAGSIAPDVQPASKGQFLMTDQEIADLIAGVTATHAAILELLVEKNLVTKAEVEHCLTDLLAEHQSEGGTAKSGAATRHLLSIVKGFSL